MSAVYKATWYIGSGEIGRKMEESVLRECKRRGLLTRRGEPAVSSLITLAIKKLIGERT